MPATLWHADAQAYAATDVRTGKPLATLYVDLYPRDGKYNHAAVWTLQSSATRIGRVPQAALVANLDRKGLTCASSRPCCTRSDTPSTTTSSATRNTQQSDN